MANNEEFRKGFLWGVSKAAAIAERRASAQEQTADQLRQEGQFALAASEESRAIEANHIWQKILRLRDAEPDRNGQDQNQTVSIPAVIAASFP